jgi:hypothetical protein
LRPSVVLLGANHEIGIAIRKGGRPEEPVVRFPNRTEGGRIERAVDEQLHEAVGAPPRDGHVVPSPVRNDAGPDDREVARDGSPYAEGKATRAERHTVVAVVAAAVDVAIDDDVAEDPVAAARRDRSGGVLAWIRLHPPLDREVGGADVDRVLGIERNLHTVDVVHAVAMKPQRKASHCARRGAGGQQAGCDEHDQAGMAAHYWWDRAMAMPGNWGPQLRRQSYS